jgi:hypothetical protein
LCGVLLTPAVLAGVATDLPNKTSHAFPFCSLSSSSRQDKTSAQVSCQCMYVNVITVSGISAIL